MLRGTQVAWNRLRGFACVGPVRLPIDRSVLSPRMERRLTRGKYERHEAGVARDLLHDGDVILELGAGIGFISSYLRKATRVGRIVTYEANPDLIAYIESAYERNAATGIEVRHGVVLPDPTTSTIPFYIRSNLLESSLSLADGPISRAVDVPVRSLASVLEEVAPTAAVIDIEGGEVGVLEASDLDPIRRLILEIHPALYGTSGMARVFAALARHGFDYRAEMSRANVLALER